MKNICLLLFSFFLSTSLSFAQNDRSSVKLRLSDGSLMKVAVNDRDFNKISASLTIGDLPGKRVRLRIYRFRPYADGKGGKAELVYSGTIKIKRGLNYDGIIDIKNRRLLLKEINPAAVYIPTPYDNELAISNEDYSNENKTEENGAPDLSGPLQTIQNAMDQVSSDIEKLAVAEKHIGNQISAEDLKQIASWFFFDETKLKFAKEFYPRVTDKENFKSLRDIFISNDSKNEFDTFLKQN